MIYIHNSNFKIHDHTRSHAINFQSIFATKIVGYLLTFSFSSCILRQTRTRHFWWQLSWIDGIYLLRLNHDVCSKKVQAFVNIHWVCIDLIAVETKGGSVLYFSQDKHKLPWVPQVFLACGGKFRCWPKADMSSAVGRSREKNLWHGAVLFTVPGDLWAFLSDYIYANQIESFRLWSCGPAREEMSEDPHYP